MLRELLRHLSDSGTISVTDLAFALGTTPQLVEAMIQDLVRRGYLVPAASKCSGACEACSVQNGCIKGTHQQVWTLSSEGRLFEQHTTVDGPTRTHRSRAD